MHHFQGWVQVLISILNFYKHYNKNRVYRWVAVGAVPRVAPLLGRFLQRRLQTVEVEALSALITAHQIGVGAFDAALVTLGSRLRFQQFQAIASCGGVVCVRGAHFGVGRRFKLRRH
jgi:hypothetical protein